MRTLELHFVSRLRTTVKKIDVPERYSELSERQFHVVCALSRNEILPDDFVLQFFGISADVWKKLPPFYHYTLTDLVRSISTTANISRFFDSYVRVGAFSRYLIQPSNMPLMQFMNADTFAQWYEYTKKDVYLIDFFCQVALPSEETDYFRHSSSSLKYELTQHIDDDKSIRPLLLDTMMNWQLIKAYLSSAFPNMFPAGDGAPSDKPTPPSNWYDVFDALIGEHLENIEAYKRLPAFDVFRIVDGRIRDKKFK